MRTQQLREKPASDFFVFCQHVARCNIKRRCRKLKVIQTRKKVYGTVLIRWVSEQLINQTTKKCPFLPQHHWIRMSKNSCVLIWPFPLYFRAIFLRQHALRTCWQEREKEKTQVDWIEIFVSILITYLWQEITWCDVTSTMGEHQIIGIISTGWLVP